MKRSNLAGLSLLALGATLLAPAAARAASWELDPAHSSVEFAVRHMMLSHVKGTFGGVTGKAELDPAQPAGAKFQAEVDVATIDTGNKQRDTHLASPDFFDVQHFPKATFVSKTIKVGGPGKLEVVGDLTMHGVTRPVTFAVEGFSAEIKDPFGSIRTGGTATTTISRKEFGMEWNKVLDAGGVLIGDEVTLTLNVELTRKP